MLVNEALKVIENEYTTTLETESVYLKDLCGRVLSNSITSKINVPSFDNSAIDGYCFKYSDISKTGSNKLIVNSIITAGDTINIKYNPGYAIKVFTGSPIPPIFDTVASNEECKIFKKFVVIPNHITLGSNFRKKGEDIVKGKMILSDGYKVKAKDIGIIASIGELKAQVYKDLKIALFSTGNELCEPGKKINSKSIYDSNRYTLIGLLKSYSADVTDLGIIRDDPDILEALLLKIEKEYDIIISSGGISLSDTDHVRSIIKKIGNINISDIAMKPGKPLIIGNINKTKFIGLPGNPAAMTSTFLRLARPLILKLSGVKSTTPNFFEVLSDFNFTKKPGRTEWLRVSVIKNNDGKLVAKKFNSEGSGILSSIVYSDGLIELSESTTKIEKNSSINFLPFSEVL